VRGEKAEYDGGTLHSHSMDISTEAIRSLRERTGAGVMDCKTALVASGGDPDRAMTILRERGKIRAAKKAGRVVPEGVIGVYVHNTKKVAALVSVRCETDFVARSAPFQDLAKDLAMHVVAMDPLAVKPEGLPETLVQEEREHLEKDGDVLGKPKKRRREIVNEKLQKILAERALLTQPFVKNPEITVGDLVAEKVTEFGENIVVEKCTRMVL